MEVESEEPDKEGDEKGPDKTTKRMLVSLPTFLWRWHSTFYLNKLMDLCCTQYTVATSPLSLQWLAVLLAQKVGRLFIALFCFFLGFYVCHFFVVKV